MAPKRIYNYLARISFFASLAHCSFNVYIFWTEMFVFGFFARSTASAALVRDRWKNVQKGIKWCLITEWFCWMFSFEYSRDSILCIVNINVMWIYYLLSTIQRTTYCLSSTLAYTQHTIDGQFFFILLVRAGFRFCEFKYIFFSQIKRKKKWGE